MVGLKGKLKAAWMELIWVGLKEICSVYSSVVLRAGKWELLMEFELIEKMVGMTVSR